MVSAVKEKINFNLPIALKSLESYMSHLHKILFDPTDIFLNDAAWGVTYSRRICRHLAHMEIMFDGALKFPFKTNAYQISVCSTNS